MEKEVPSCPALREARKKTINKLAHQNLYAKRQMKKIIELQNIKRNFRVGEETVHALRGISFTICEGEFVTIMGTSGSGKSTLLNRLTDAGVLAENKLFATLDPTTRRLELPGGTEVLLSDTVGFIRKLPHHLVRAFRSTLDELCYADILVVLADASDSECAEQLRVTDSLIAQLGAGDKPVLYAFNKADLAEDGMALISGEAQNAVFISAKTGMGMDCFLDMLEALATAGTRRLTLHIPMAEQGVLNQLYRFATVEDVHYEDDRVTVTAVLDSRAQGMFKNYIV